MALNIRLNEKTENLQKYYELYTHIIKDCIRVQSNIYLDLGSHHSIQYRVIEDKNGITTIVQQLRREDKIEPVCSFDSKGNYKTYFETI